MLLADCGDKAIVDVRARRVKKAALSSTLPYAPQFGTPLH